MKPKFHLKPVFALLGLALWGGVFGDTNETLTAARTLPAYFSLDTSARSAYQSRGRILEDRPGVMNLLRVGFDSKGYGDFGRVGFWHFDVSALSDRCHTMRRHALNEMDYGVFWMYDWDFGRYGDDWKGWSLKTDFVKDWITLNGYARPYRERKTNASINEWRLGQSLENPWITPFYLFRRGVHPNQWLYTQTGLRHRFSLRDDLTFTPIFYAEHGNNFHFQRRYGRRPDGGRHYHGGIMSCNTQFELAWKLSKNFSLYILLHQFDIANEDARRSVKANRTKSARRDLTIVSTGLRCTF